MATNIGNIPATQTFYLPVTPAARTVLTGKVGASQIFQIDHAGRYVVDQDGLRPESATVAP